MYIQGGAMNIAKIFKSGNSQAIRLPKEFRLNQEEVYITKIGDSILLTPHKEKWLNLVNSLDLFSDDFMDERNQLQLENREEL